MTNKIMTAFSTKDKIDDAVKDIKAQLGDFDAKMLLYFTSTKYAPEPLSSALGDAFSGAAVFGCTTAGEIVTGKMLKNSIVAMAFGPGIVNDVKIEVLENISQDSQAVPRAFSSFEKHFKTPAMDLDPSKHVGIILIDGLSGSEEKIMEKIGDLTNLTFIGASAGDDLKFAKTHVFAGGKSYSNAAVLAVIKTESGFDFIKTQSFVPLSKKLVPTSVDTDKRQVLEFNNKPASAAYAEALGIPAEKLSERFMHNPVGLMSGDEPFVRSPQRIDGNSVFFYCSVRQGMELSILESTDIVKQTREAVEAKKKELGSFSGIINFHCILRTLELDQKGTAGEYGQIFADIPTIGFSTYGEEFVGHINQTSTMLVFK